MFQQAVIHFFTEASNHGLFEELVKRNAFLFAVSFCGDADAPFVIGDMHESVFFHEPDRVEVAAYRLPEINLTFVVGFLYGAESGAVLVKINECTFFIINKLRHHVAFIVVVVDVVLFNRRDAFTSHIRFDLLDVLFNYPDLLRFERGAGIARDTTFTLAARKTAAKPRVQKFVSEYDIVDDYHCC